MICIIRVIYTLSLYSRYSTREWIKSPVEYSCEVFLKNKELKERVKEMIIEVRMTDEVKFMCNALSDCIEHGYRHGKEVMIEEVNPLLFDFGEFPLESVCN